MSSGFSNCNVEKNKVYNIQRFDTIPYIGERAARSSVSCAAFFAMNASASSNNKSLLQVSS